MSTRSNTRQRTNGEKQKQNEPTANDRMAEPEWIHDYVKYSIVIQLFNDILISDTANFDPNINIYQRLLRRRSRRRRPRNT